ncbi:CGNR zinc finger domain-containing protein [Streptomyces kebangsaanensis]|uniref:CGNR zinc finger domain-containing protein n=1 Tax=Streptomyces kebangsaanensis TaxID=864058 RepID=UPI00093FA597|nr:CGNR zinc finger domain-containing protein [Streptomyces kebangsaanensis]
MERRLAPELASTIRHDGDGGVVDDLATVQGVTRRLRQQEDLLPADIPADEDLSLRITEVRRAVRALFARVVSPSPPSRADVHRLMPADQALTHLNAVAAVDPVTPRREQLRACTAPRCVRYFVKSHGRQEWCKPSCGNRARAARHYRRRRQASESASASAGKTC